MIRVKHSEGQCDVSLWTADSDSAFSVISDGSYEYCEKIYDQIIKELNNKTSIFIEFELKDNKYCVMKNNLTFVRLDP